MRTKKVLDPTIATVTRRKDLRKDPVVSSSPSGLRKNPVHSPPLGPFTFSVEIGWHEHQVRDLVSGSNRFLKAPG